MKMNQTVVRIVGVLFLVQMAAAVISYSVILEPLLYKTDFLQKLIGSSFWVRMAVLFDLLTGAAVLAIAVLLYPILKRFSQRIALWYVAQRLTELVGFMISGILLLTILRIGNEISAVSAEEASQMELIAIYLRSTRGNIQNISLLIYCLGAWSFFGLLLHSRLIPGFISIWGLIGVTLLFIEIVSNIFGTSIGGIMIMIPLGICEVFLGFWLIIKGFNSSMMAETKPGLDS